MARFVSSLLSNRRTADTTGVVVVRCRLNTMIETILNFLLHCHHRHLSRPVGLVRKRGLPQCEPYVVCLDCGQHFAYDTRQMQIGKPLVGSHQGGDADRGVQGSTPV